MFKKKISSTFEKFLFVHLITWIDLLLQRCVDLQISDCSYPEFIPVQQQRNRCVTNQKQQQQRKL